MLQEDRLAYCFSLTHELPDVEFKGVGRGRDNPLFGKVIRAAMALANRRGGGTIIIGVVETPTGLDFKGLTPEMLATWKYEDIASGFNSYTNVPIEFDRQAYEYSDNTFLILDIHEFNTVPIFCMKEYRDKSHPQKPEKECPIILRCGGFYIRTLNKPESKEMLTSEEVRTLFELANDKAIQSFVTRTKLAGITIAPQPKDEELFAHQLQEWAGPILQRIRTRGYWDICIHPVSFEQEREPLSELRSIIIRASLNYRGWEFPYNTPVLPEIGVDWIGLENQHQNSLQSWRFFQSGQFVAAAALLDDWSEELPNELGRYMPSGTYLSTLDAVFRLTEVFGLASRLAVSDVYCNEQSMVIDLKLCNIQKSRQLYSRGVYQIFSLSGYTTSAENIPYRKVFLKEDIIGRWRELALEAAQFFFERFGYSPSKQLLTTMQAELQIHK